MVQDHAGGNGRLGQSKPAENSKDGSAHHQDTALDPIPASTPEGLHHEETRPKGIPDIVLSDIGFGRTVDLAEEAILAAGHGLYQRHGSLVRVVGGGAAASENDGLLPRTEPVPPHALWGMAADSARWWRRDRDGVLLPSQPQAKVIQALMSRGSWRFPHLRSVAVTPTLRADGSIVSRPGYDPATRIYFDPCGVDFPPIPANPGLQDALRALDDVMEPFSEFPFRRPCHRSAVLAALLTIVGRHAIAGPVPAFAVTSTCGGSGKGLLVNVISVTATGRPARARVWPESGPEVRKDLLTVTREGHAMAQYDNVDIPVRSGFLASLLTAEWFEGRGLGSNRTAGGPVHTVLFLNGINLRIGGDLYRRVIPSELHPGVEHPERRTDFRRDEVELIEFVRRERSRLVVAALTILRAFILAGAPCSPRDALGTFSAWSRLIRGACIWLGLEDPVAGMSQLSEDADEDRETKLQFLRAWHGAFGTREVLLVDALEAVRRAEDPRVLMAAQDAAALRDLGTAMRGLDQSCDGRSLSPRRIGNRMADMRDRIIGGLTLRKGARQGRGVPWRVLPADRGPERTESPRSDATHPPATQGSAEGHESRGDSSDSPVAPGVPSAAARTEDSDGRTGHPSGMERPKCDAHVQGESPLPIGGQGADRSQAQAKPVDDTPFRSLAAVDDAAPPTGEGESRAERSLTPAIDGPMGAVTFVNSRRNHGIGCEFRYFLVPIDRPVVSHIKDGHIVRSNPAYPAGLQHRERDRLSNDIGIGSGSKRLDPELLLFRSPHLAYGSPIVGPDLAVESGNGRFMILRAAIMHDPEGWGAYQRLLRERLGEFGFGEGALDGREDLVLVRMRVTPLTEKERAAFTREANEVDVQQFSAWEMATVDAARLPEDWATGLAASDSAPVLKLLRMSANATALCEFVGLLAGPEAIPLLTHRGEASKDLLTRLLRAMFVKTYGSAARDVGLLLFESNDAKEKKLLAALLDSLPSMARAEALIRTGRRDAALSIAGDLVAAVSLILGVRGAGDSVAWDLTVQGHFEPPATPFQSRLALDIDRLGRSGWRIRAMIQAYAQQVIDSPDLGQGTFEPEQPIKKEDLWARAIAHAMALPARSRGRNSGGSTTAG